MFSNSKKSNFITAFWKNCDWIFVRVCRAQKHNFLWDKNFTTNKKSISLRWSFDFLSHWQIPQIFGQVNQRMELGKYLHSWDCYHQFLSSDIFEIREKLDEMNFGRDFWFFGSVGFSQCKTMTLTVSYGLFAWMANGTEKSDDPGETFFCMTMLNWPSWEAPRKLFVHWSMKFSCTLTIHRA